MSTVARFADRIQSESRNTAAAARSPAVDPAEQLAAAFAHARTEGYAAGLDDAAAELSALKERLLAEQRSEQEAQRRDSTRQRQAVEDALHALRGQHEALIAQAHALAVELGYQAACAVIGQRAVERQLVSDLVRDALEKRNDEPLRLRLGSALHALAEVPVGLESVSDPALDPYGCVVESRRGQRASSLEQRLRALADALLQTLETADDGAA